MPRRELQGVVISAKSNSTISVNVERRFRHPLYQKIVKKTKKYSVHAPENNYREGDIVKIIECKPISKTKSWIVVAE